MNDKSAPVTKLPPEQQAIRDKCFHPSGTFVEFPMEDVETSIPERFDKIADKFAERVAVKTKNETLTYTALNQIANGIGHAVLQQCAGGEQLVVVLLEKSSSAIATILGVLKTGKMYLVLDPSFPKDRLSFLLDDAKADLLVTNRKNFSLAKALIRGQEKLLNLDDIDANVFRKNLRFAISPDAFDYIRYTSGSTGEPKGILENHRNMLHNVANITNLLHICANDCATLLGSLSGGQASTDMYAALLNGAALFLWNSEQEGLAALSRWLVQEEITYLRSSATAFRCFIDTLSAETRFPSLRIIRLGGEPVFRKDFESYKKHTFRGCVMVNALSLGEARTICLNFLDAETSMAGINVPVGYALPGKEILLINDSGQSVWPGEIGEITVRSRYLSPGYWRKPELTKEKFLPDPNSENERIYRTGDMGCMLPDGCLFYIGRKDFQLKVRGYRVEPAEAEGVLASHAAVKEVAVVGSRDRAGDTQLVCFYVSTRRPGPSANELRTYAGEYLPDYMIPSVFVSLESMPLTPNGKIDRRALRIFQHSRPRSDRPFQKARNSVESQLISIWRDVLGIDQLDIHDNFFELGGHSLAASRIVSRVIQTFQLDLPLKALFESPTVAEMAALITLNRARSAQDKEIAEMLREVEVMKEEEAANQIGGKSIRTSSKGRHE